jgi:hypothetical protein
MAAEAPSRGWSKEYLVELVLGASQNSHQQAWSDLFEPIWSVRSLVSSTTNDETVELVARTIDDNSWNAWEKKKVKVLDKVEEIRNKQKNQRQKKSITLKHFHEDVDRLKMVCGQRVALLLAGMPDYETKYKDEKSRGMCLWSIISFREAAMLPDTTHPKDSHTTQSTRVDSLDSKRRRSFDVSAGNRPEKRSRVQSAAVQPMPAIPDTQNIVATHNLEYETGQEQARVTRDSPDLTQHVSSHNEIIGTPEAETTSQLNDLGRDHRKSATRDTVSSTKFAQGQTSLFGQILPVTEWDATLHYSIQYDCQYDIDGTADTMVVYKWSRSHALSLVNKEPIKQEGNMWYFTMDPNQLPFKSLRTMTVRSNHYRWWTEKKGFMSPLSVACPGQSEESDEIPCTLFITVLTSDVIQ